MDFFATNLGILLDICERAGASIISIREGGMVSVIEKGDGSPLSNADSIADEIVCAGLRNLRSSVAIISEESYDGGAILHDEYWLVDALDGSKEYLCGSGEFTVNIAYISGGEVIFGLVYVPVAGKFYYGYGGRAWLRCGDDERIIKTRSIATGGVKAYGSLRHGNVEAVNNFLAGYDIVVGEYIGMGSSLKFCLLAEGLGDIYVRLSPTSLWDTAAGHGVLLGAGGQVYVADGGVLRYDGGGVLNDNFVAVSGALSGNFGKMIC